MVTAADDRFSSSLQEMISEMERAPEVVRPSRFWEFLAGLGMDDLADSGLREFKRTVNSNYFQWVPTLRDPQVRAAARAWLAHPSPVVFRARIEDPEARISTRIGDSIQGRGERLLYAVYVAMLWECCAARLGRSTMAALDEPSLGNPVTVQHRGHSITQDLCNSALEYESILRGLPGAGVLDDGVIELGGGYGRLAWFFLQRHPGLRYVMVDIPPALAIAQAYLTSVFPDRPAFRFRHFDAAADVADELASAELVFLTPNQLNLLPPEEAGLFVNVSSLHEMRPEQIAHYLRQVARHTSGYFYSKQWYRSSNPYDGVTIERSDYPIPESWGVVFDRQHPIQRRFFEALYDVLPEA